jgi:hypothetical protein
VNMDIGYLKGLILLSLFFAACSSGEKTPGLSVDGDVLTAEDTQVAIDQIDGEGIADGIILDAMGDTSDAVEDSMATDLEDTAETVANPVQACENMPVTWLDSVCASFCEQLLTFNLNDLFAPPEECHLMCREVIEEHPDWLANFICVTAMEQHYFFGNCWWPKPLPAIDHCPAWCDEMIGCGLESAWNLPGDKCLCEAACNGIFAMTGEAADPLLECATKALADTCDLEAVGECYQMPLNCDETCSGMEEQCDAGEDLTALFPDEEDCIDFCQHSSQEQQFGLQVCISVAGCPNADLCAEFPEEAEEGCAEFCNGYNALCPMAEIPADFCPWACTGAAMALPGSDVAGSADCIEALGQCPDDDGASFVGCLSGQCTSMCYGVSTDCEPGSAYFDLYPNGEACEEVCDLYTPFQAEVANMCHLVAGCDNPELCGSPPLTMAAGCGAYCDGLLGLCPDIPWFSGISCEAFCTGMLMVVPKADPASAPDCFDAFGVCPADWEEAIFTCLSGKCGGLCGHFDECDGDSQYYEQFESENACKEQCSQVNWDTAMAMNWCLSWGACDGAAECMTVPDEPPVGCDIYCETVFEICPENGLGSVNTCDNACLGLTMAYDSAQPWDADECLEEYDSCPENPAEIIYGCIIDADSSCVEACAQLENCDLTDSWVCEIFCSELEADDPLFHTYFTDCVENAATCEELAPCVGQ